MKKINVNFIDNCSHGYYSVSKKDIIKSGVDINEISGFSGLTLNRVYLEEDCDAALFFNKCKENNIEVVVNRTYNPKFDKRHNYTPKLFNFVPRVGMKLFVGKQEYFITSISDNYIVINNTHKLSTSNPFKYITDYE